MFHVSNAPSHFGVVIRDFSCLGFGNSGRNRRQNAECSHNKHGDNGTNSLHNEAFP